MRIVMKLFFVFVILFFISCDQATESSPEANSDDSFKIIVTNSYSKDIYVFFKNANGADPDFLWAVGRVKVGKEITFTGGNATGVYLSTTYKYYAYEDATGDYVASKKFSSGTTIGYWTVK